MKGVGQEKWILSARNDLIGKIKTSAQHLGLSLSMNLNTGYDSTYTTALRKMEKKSNSIFF